MGTTIALIALGIGVMCNAISSLLNLSLIRRINKELEELENGRID